MFVGRGRYFSFRHQLQLATSLLCAINHGISQAESSHRRQTYLHSLPRAFVPWGVAGFRESCAFYGISSVRWETDVHACACVSNLSSTTRKSPRFLPPVCQKWYSSHILPITASLTRDRKSNKELPSCQSAEGKEIVFESGRQLEDERNKKTLLSLSVGLGLCLEEQFSARLGTTFGPIPLVRRTLPFQCAEVRHGGISLQRKNIQEGYGSPGIASEDNPCRSSATPPCSW